MPIREGRNFYKENIKQGDTILPELWFYNQKNNVNPDGSDNMDASKIWGRFNQCFISSSTGYMNALCSWKDRQGHKRLRNSTMDELAYMLVITNHKHGVTTKDNPDRFVWQRHVDLINETLHGAFENPGEVSFQKLNTKNLNLIVDQIEKGIQPLFSLYIGKYLRGAKGHIVTCGGVRVLKKKLEGIYLLDPAGDLLSENSYRDAIPGFMIYIPKEHFPKIFPENHILVYKD